MLIPLGKCGQIIRKSSFSEHHLSSTTWQAKDRPCWGPCKEFSLQNWQANTSKMPNTWLTWVTKKKQSAQSRAKCNTCNISGAMLGFRGHLHQVVHQYMLSVRNRDLYLMNFECFIYNPKQSLHFTAHVRTEACLLNVWMGIEQFWEIDSIDDFFLGPLVPLGSCIGTYWFHVVHCWIKFQIYVYGVHNPSTVR